MLDDGGFNFDDARRALYSGLGQHVKAVHQLAKDVELRLARGGVADADRRGALIAGQPVKLPLGQEAAAVDPVDDLHRGGLACDRAQDPVAPARRLFVEAGVEQRGQREGGVAQPAIAIVPVCRSAWDLGQSKRRGGDDPAAFPVDQRAQRDQRAANSPVPRAFRAVAG